jgi:hypothetical protein
VPFISLPFVVFPQPLDQLPSLRNELLESFQPFFVYPLLPIFFLLQNFIGLSDFALIDFLFPLMDDLFIGLEVLVPLLLQFAELVGLFLVRLRQLFPPTTFLLLDLQHFGVQFVLDGWQHRYIIKTKSLIFMTDIKC